MSLDADVHVEVAGFALDLRLVVEPGEVLAVLGPNGSGKTTLLRVLAGLQPLDRGRVELDGRVLDDPEAKVLVAPQHRPCGMLFQDQVLFPHLSVLENVAFGLRSRGVGRADARRKAQDWLDVVGLGANAEQSTTALSGGEAQRIALARTLATEPTVLLLDEPMGSLDVTSRASLRVELRDRLASFAGYGVLVTHDARDAAAIADRVMVVEAGRVVQQGTLEEVAARPGSPFVAALAHGIEETT